MTEGAATDGATGGAVIAVDLGATSGRVMIGRVAGGTVSLEQIARFSNGPVSRSDGWHWDVAALFAHVLDGLAQAVRCEPDVASIGIDSWAVDYGLLRDGALLGEPFHYRDDRTAAGVEAVHAIVPFDELYRRNGLQFLPFNTVYQYLAESRLADADTALLIPDLLAEMLTGRVVAERTNASTTGLLDVRTSDWDTDLAARLGLTSSVMPPLVDPGTVIGSLRSDLVDAIGTPLNVIAVGSHDTASAVAAVPLSSRRAAYISCGTWGLVGLELDEPIVSDAARAANFTNELGVDGRIRFLHNVTGLWMLSESLRTWGEEDGTPPDLGQLLDAAAAEPPPTRIFDANHPSLSAPGNMPARISHLLGTAPPTLSDRPTFVRTIIESIAAAFADAVHTASELADQPVDAIHIVGGGALNALLCQATADRSGLSVLAGPVEATALGNVLVQARAHGWFGPDATLETLRAAVAASFPPRRFDAATRSRRPRSDTSRA